MKQMTVFLGVRTSTRPKAGLKLSQRGIEAVFMWMCAARLSLESLWHIQQGPKSIKVLLIRGANKSSSVNTCLPRPRVGLIPSIYIKAPISRPTHYHVLYAPALRKHHGKVAPSSPLTGKWRSFSEQVSAATNSPPVLDQQRGRKELDFFFL